MISNTVAVIILIKLGASIYVVKLGSSVLFFTTPLIVSLYIRKRYSLTSKCEPDYSAIKGRSAVTFHSISNLIHNNTDVVLLTLFFDAKIISIYSIHNLIICKVRALLLAFTTGIEAAFGDMWAKHDYNLLQDSFNHFEYILFSFVSVIFSCITVLFIPFIQIYTQNISDVNYVRPALAYSFIVSELFFCLRQPYLIIVYSTGSFEDTKIGAAVEAILNIILSILLMTKFGLIGIVFGTIFANLFRTVQFALYVSKHILHRKYIYLIYRALWLVATSGISIALIKYLIQWVHPSSGWEGWITKGVIAFLISSVITFLSSILFYKNDISFLFNKVKGLVKIR